jgi:hypothetical protein
MSFGPLVAGVLIGAFGGSFNRVSAFMACFALLSILLMLLGRENQGQSVAALTRLPLLRRNNHAVYRQFVVCCICSGSAAKSHATVGTPPYEATRPGARNESSSPIGHFNRRSAGLSKRTMNTRQFLGQHRRNKAIAVT